MIIKSEQREATGNGVKSGATGHLGQRVIWGNGSLGQRGIWGNGSLGQRATATGSSLELTNSIPSRRSTGSSADTKTSGNYSTSDLTPRPLASRRGAHVCWRRRRLQGVVR